MENLTLAVPMESQNEGVLNGRDYGSYKFTDLSQSIPKTVMLRNSS